MTAAISSYIYRLVNWLSFAEFLEWLGSHWGNQRDYLECAACRREYDWLAEVNRCEACGGELHVVVPNGEELQIRWLCWKTGQKWWPQRMYHALPEPSYRYWQWLGREWLVKHMDWS